MRRAAMAIVLAGIAAGSCQGDREVGTARAALRAITSCEDLEAALRQRAIDEMREAVLANYRAALAHDCGGGAYAPGGEWDADAAESSAGAPPPDAARSDGAEQYSTTNVQELGVDEADFVKNDGAYIYLVGGTQFLIVDAWPPEMAEVVSRTEIEGTPRLLYVYDDHAVVYSDVDVERDPTSPARDDCYWDEYEGRTVCGASTRGTKITVLDIADRARPRLEREIVLTGEYVSSRRIEGAVHTVMTFPEVGFPELRTWPAGLATCPSEAGAALWAAVTRLIQENERIIEETPLRDIAPSMSETRYGEDGTALVRTDFLGQCSGFYEAPASEGRTFLSVASFDVGEAGDVVITSILGDQGVVYASRDSLYVASRQSRPAGRAWFFPEASGVDEATTVHRFRFAQGRPATTYEASGVVAGRVLNQFSMGEHEDDLRIATTIGHVPNPGTSNNVSVVREQDGALEVVGEVTGIAPGEDIRSARFVGDRGFVVTFQKTDPLFTLDLSDPEHPFVSGELHIPGYSTYMHMMDDDHLLTIGFDAQEMGTFAWFQGVMLQIFDVGDMSTPSLVHREVIGTRGTSSEATGNHLAFNYFAPLDLLAIPMAICEGGHDGTYGDEMTFNGLLVYDVTVDGGFHEHGRVAHVGGGTASCSNWWTNPASHVKRSIIMDDYVFSVAADELVVASLDDLSAPLTSIALPTAPDEGDSYGY